MPVAAQAANDDAARAELAPHVPMVRGGEGRARPAIASVARVRRLLLVVSLVVLVDTMLFAALGPLLPEYAEAYGLSKSGAGFLVAVYALGVLVGALPAGLASARFGRRATTVAGLALMGAASVGFAFAADEWALGFSRLLQGFGSALSWSGGLAWLVALTPSERRGEMLGTALAGAIFGAMLGPALGGAAALVGEKPAFVGVGMLNAILALVAARTPDAPDEPARARLLVRAFRERGFSGGLWLMFLPALLFGVVSVLIPLELDRGGWGPAAIGGVFLAAAGLEAVITPLVGRAFDRTGGMRPIRVALVASVVGSVALALVDGGVALMVVVLLASVAYGALFAPGLALLSHGAERAGLSQGLAFAVMNAAWAWGALAGPAGGGAVGEVDGDAAAYGAGALACLGTLAAASLASWHSPAASATDRLHSEELAR